jgi:hypothetical protein
MSEMPEPVRRALDRHDAFSPSDDGFSLDTTVFETVVTATPAEGKRDGRFLVTVSMPSLDAAVAGETVHEIVEEGWFETLSLRLEDTFDVATTSSFEEPRVEHHGDEVRVELEYTSWNAREGVEDAKATAEFVEGTYAQGIIPGYEYHGPAAMLLENAVQNADNGTSGPAGGPPR